MGRKMLVFSVCFPCILPKKNKEKKIREGFSKNCVQKRFALFQRAAKGVENSGEGRAYHKTPPQTVLEPLTYKTFAPMFFLCSLP